MQQEIEPQRSDSDDPASKYIVLTENIEIGTLFFGAYEASSPSAAVRAVLSGDYQSPPADLAYDIAADDASSFTVYEVTGEETTVTRDAGRSHGRWKVTESGDTATLHHDDTPVIDFPRQAIDELFTALATVYPEPSRVADEENIHDRAPEYESFVNPTVGPIRIYAGSPEENALMWVDFMTTFEIPTRADAHDLLTLLNSLYPQQTKTLKSE